MEWNKMKRKYIHRNELFWVDVGMVRLERSKNRKTTMDSSSIHERCRCRSIENDNYHIISIIIIIIIIIIVAKEEPGERLRGTLKERCIFPWERSQKQPPSSFFQTFQARMTRIPSIITSTTQQLLIHPQSHPCQKFLFIQTTIPESDPEKDAQILFYLWSI